MKRRSFLTKILLLVLILCSVFVLASCNAEEPEEEPTGDSAEEECSHTFGNWTVTKEALCEDGSRERICTKCQEKEVQILDATQDHVYGEWTIVKKSSCQNGEERRKECKTCDLVIKDSSEEKGYHDYEDYTCTFCGLEASKGLEYTLSEDKTYYILCGIGECKDENIVVLDTYEELPVKVIKASAFEGNITIKDISIPETVEEIGANAFKGCTAIINFVVPESVTKIGEAVFDGCVSLESITLPFVGAEKDGTENTHFGYIFGAKTADANNSSIPDKLKSVNLVGAESISAFAFNGCSKLTSIELGEELKTIGNAAFADCDGLTRIVLPSGVKEISQMTFYGCDALSSVSLPDSLEKISAYAFYNCEKLGSITIPKSVKSISDSAFKNCKALVTLAFSGTELVNIGASAFEGCVSIQKLTFSEGLESIGDSAFAGCKMLNSIVFSSTITGIGDFAFSNCEELVELKVPKNVTIIGDSAFSGCIKLEIISFDMGSKIAVIEDNAFSGCSALLKIAYSGTQKAWGEVNKGDKWDDNTGDYVLECSDDDVTE